MKIFVGNIASKVTEDELQKLFAEYGEVESALIIFDKLTEQSRGFGFIRMPREDEATAAINELDGKKLKGKKLKVNRARQIIKGHESGNRRSGPPKFED